MRLRWIHRRCGLPAVAVALTLASVVGAAVAVVPASAAPVATAARTPDASAPSTELSSTVSSIDQARIASNAAGDTTAVWKRRPSPRTSELVSASRVAGGPWSAPEVVASTASTQGRNPTLVQLAVAPDGTADLLWIADTWPGHDRRDAISEVSRRPVGAPWQTPIVIHGPVATGAVLPQGLDMVVTPAGEAVVVGPRDDAPLRSTASTPMIATVISPRGERGPDRPIGLADPNGGALQLAMNRRGAVIATWLSPGQSRTNPETWVVRGTDGSWSPPSNEDGLNSWSGTSYEYLLLGDDGKAWMMQDNEDPTKIRAWSFGVARAMRRSPSAQAPSAQAGQWPLGVADDRWAFSRAARLDAAGRPVIAYFLEDATHIDNDETPERALTVDGIWSTGPGPDGVWRTTAIDPLGSTTHAGDVDLSGDARGRVVATWSSTSTIANCKSLIYRATRTPGGTWGRRVLVAIGPGRHQFVTSCGEPDTTFSGDGRAPVVGWVQGRSFRARPVPAVSSSPARLKTEDVTTTWKAIRAAHGISITCRGPAAGYCGASPAPGLVATRHQRSKAQLSALRCLVHRSLAPVAQRGRLTLGAGLTCLHGIAKLPPVRFTVLVTADALGHPASARTIHVTIRR